MILDIQQANGTRSPLNIAALQPRRIRTIGCLLLMRRRQHLHSHHQGLTLRRVTNGRGRVLQLRRVHTHEIRHHRYVWRVEKRLVWRKHGHIRRWRRRWVRQRGVHHDGTIGWCGWRCENGSRGTRTWCWKSGRRRRWWRRHLAGQIDRAHSVHHEVVHGADGEMKRQLVAAKTRPFHQRVVFGVVFRAQQEHIVEIAALAPLDHSLRVKRA